MSATDAVVAGVVEARRLLRGIMGADAYERYLEFHAASHGAEGHPPMSEREFWRDRDDRRDRNPEGRCC
jgi:uncharacterized short protein YbdD (DUF466 family)